MRKVLSLVMTLVTAVGLLGFVAPISAVAQVGPGSTVLLYNSGDPCRNPNVIKSFAVLAITTAATTELVAATAGKTVYLCSVEMVDTGTTPTVVFKTGTKVSTACDTGAANQSGTYALTSGALVKFDASGNTFLTGALSGELCLTSTGQTGTGIQGNVTYVQQ